MREKVRSSPELIRAKEYAGRAHNLKMHGKQLFIKHLNNVYNVAIRFGITDENILIACYLKSVCDETKTVPAQIKYAFGNSVGEIVERVTHDLSSNNRQENLLKTYAKIKGHEESTIVKLSDVIASIEQAQQEKNHNLIRTYHQDYKKMRESMRVEGIADIMWNHLEYLLDV